MYYLLILLFALSALPLQSAPATGKIVKETITIAGKDRSYFLFLPQGVTASKLSPLILTLHGSGGGGRSLVEEWKDLANKEGIIVAGPNALSTAGWSLSDDGPDVLHEMIESLKARHPVDPRRVYIFGYSAGAVYGLKLALHESEYFAATSVFAGAMDPASYGTVSFAKRKIPIAIFVGADDPFFPLVRVRATRDFLKKNGFPVHLKEIWENDSGHDHNYRAVAVTVNRDSWKFLKEHQLSQDPHHRSFGKDPQ